MENPTITEEEVELYDRQIRLWGTEIQSSLRLSNILIIGLTGVGAEICKNLVLAGIKSVTIMDNSAVTENDLQNIFLLKPDDLGKNRAKAYATYAHILNPNVTVKFDDSAPTDKPVSYFSQFDVVCATKLPFNVLTLLDGICSSYNVKFYAADTVGQFGYIFVNLQEYTVGGENNDEKCKERYPSLSSILQVSWDTPRAKKFLQKTDASYILFKAIVKFIKEHGHQPISTDKEKLEKLIIETQCDFDFAYPTDNIIKDLFDESGPSCSIIGGLGAQEIILSFGQQRMPFSLFLFNPSKTQMFGLKFKQPPLTPIF